MKKKIFAIAMMALATAGTTSVFAARPDTKNANCTQAQCQNTPCTTKATCGPDSCNAPCFRAFEGLNLTADQQTKLQALRQQGKVKADQKKADQKKAREEAKTKRDQSRRDYLASVKAILTPEQYVQFLENSYVNAPLRGTKMQAKGIARHNGKKDIKRDGKRAERPQRPDSGK